MVLSSDVCIQIEEAKGTSALPAPAASAEAIPAAAAAAPAAAAPKSEAVPIGKWEPVAAPAPPDAPRDGGKGGGGAGIRGGGEAAAAGERTTSATGVFGVGARVEVLSADKWYPAVSCGLFFVFFFCKRGGGVFVRTNKEEERSRPPAWAC